MNDSKDEEVFVNAEIFRDAAKVIALRVSHDGIDVFTKYKMFVVAFTNEAIAIELYLKCIYFIENGKLTYSGNHRLDKLFNRLSEKNKDQIKAYYLEYVKVNPIHNTFLDKELSLDDVLFICKDAFNNNRFEFEKGPSEYILGDFLNSLRRLILELRPHYLQLISPEKVQVVPPVSFLTPSTNGSMINSVPQDAPPIYFNALAFKDASDLLGERITYTKSPESVKDVLHYGAIMNQAISIELLLKTVLQLEQKQNITSHDLELLYNSLSTESKKKIREYYSIALKKRNTIARGIENGRKAEDYEFDKVLHSGRHAVIGFRYLHENGWGNYALGGILVAVWMRLRDIEPPLPILLPFKSVVFNPHAQFCKTENDTPNGTLS